MNKPCVLIGGGGHAAVLLDSLVELGEEVVAVISPRPISFRMIFNEFKWFDSDNAIDQFDVGEITVINGIGPSPWDRLRRQLQEKYESAGYEFGAVLSSCSSISRFSVIGGSTQVMRGAVVQTGVKIGTASVINTGARVDHDCVIGEFSHVAPGAVLCGGVILEQDVYIGANATILPGLKIGSGCIIGAGAVVKKDVPTGCVVHPALGIVTEIAEK